MRPSLGSLGRMLGASWAILACGHMWACWGYVGVMLGGWKVHFGHFLVDVCCFLVPATGKNTGLFVEHAENCVNTSVFARRWPKPL